MLEILRDELALALALLRLRGAGGGLAGPRAARLRSVVETASAPPIVGVRWPSEFRGKSRFERVHGVGALFSAAYGNVGSSIYYALGRGGGASRSA